MFHLLEQGIYSSRQSRIKQWLRKERKERKKESEVCANGSHTSICRRTRRKQLVKRQIKLIGHSELARIFHLHLGCLRTLRHFLFVEAWVTLQLNFSVTSCNWRTATNTALCSCLQIRKCPVLIKLQVLPLPCVYFAAAYSQSETLNPEPQTLLLAFCLPWPKSSSQALAPAASLWTLTEWMVFKL